MSNKYADELLVIAEDYATMQIAQGFAESQGVDVRRVRVLPCRSGWQDVAVGMRNVRLDLYLKRHCLAVVDFDGCGEQRRRTFRQLLEENGVALERAYVMGPASNAEKMRRTLMERGYAVRHLSDVGRSLARACFQSQPFELLRSEELAHNAGELQRLCAAVKSFAMETE